MLSIKPDRELFPVLSLSQPVSLSKPLYQPASLSLYQKKSPSTPKSLKSPTSPKSPTSLTSQQAKIFQSSTCRSPDPQPTSSPSSLHSKTWALPT